MIARAHTRLSAEQYFSFCDRHPDERWELIDGLLWPHPDYAGGANGLASPTRGHQAIVRNIVRALEAGLPAPCRPEESMAVRVPSATATFRQPDVLVSCDTFIAEARFVEEPRAAIEVLSEPTAAVDLLDKPIEFAQVSSLALYVVVDSRKRRVLAFNRQKEFVPEEITEYVDIEGARLTLDQMYAGLAF